MLRNTMTDNHATLFCLVDGESTSNAFTAEIGPTKTVDGLKKVNDLKKAIKAERLPALTMSLLMNSFSGASPSPSPKATTRPQFY